MQLRTREEAHAVFLQGGWKPTANKNLGSMQVSARKVEGKQIPT